MPKMVGQNKGFGKISEKLEREIILTSANQAYELRKKDPKKRQEDQKEIDLWDSTLFDGLEDE